MTEYQFSFKPDNDKSEMIAIISSGVNKGKTIYLNKNDKTDIENYKADLLFDFVMEKKIRITQKQLDDLADAVVDEIPPTDERMLKLYEEFMKNQKQTKEILLRDSDIEIVPYQGNSEDVQRQGIFLAACAGAGKTYFISKYCKLFNKLYPKSPIYLFSAKPITDEKSFTGVKKLKQIPLDDESLDEIIENGLYKNFISITGQSLVIWDDYDAVTKDIEKKLDLIQNSVLQVGRSSRIFYIVSKHTLNEGKRTKLLWNESSDIVLFPHGLSRHSLIYAMKMYLGFDQKMIDKILNHKSRWVSIHNRLTRYYVTENTISII